MENKFGKYLKYATGEIILVVIGILIALQINNWNLNRKTGITVQNTLQELKQEFKANYQLLDSHEKKMTEGNHYLIKVLNYSAGKDEDLSIESLREYTSKMLSIDSIEISTSSLDGVITTGNISLLDSELVSSLTVFVAGYDKFTSVDEIHRQNIFDDKSNELLMNFIIL